MVKVLNFCDYNLARFGGEVYGCFKDNPEVVVSQPPQCLDRCYECLQSPIVFMGEIVDTTNISLDVWVLLKSKTTKDLVKSINEKLNQ